MSKLWEIVDDNGILWVYDGEKIRDPEADDFPDNGYHAPGHDEAVIELIRGGYIDPLRFVHCVNLHDELVEALEELAHKAGPLTDLSLPDQAEIGLSVALEDARSALNKLEQENTDD